jgi:prepilin-type N-terminal cleavage/methylation domain-containing protein
MKLGVAPGQTSASETKTGGNHVESRAFTLVEVLCAVAISALIILGLFFGIAQGFSLIQTSRENLRATQIMVGTVEGLRLCRWDQLTNTTIVPINFTNYFYSLNIGGVASNSVVYKGKITVADVPASFSSVSPSYATSMKQVTVKVDWTDIRAGSSVSYSKSFTTYVAQYGIQQYIY